jgi:uncharacterized GH25 family protein
MRRLLLIVLFASQAMAHDFWIEPSSYRPALGETVSVSLRVGENFTGDPIPRMEHRIESFLVRDRNGVRTVEGVEGSDPAGEITAGSEPAVIGYRSHFSSVELERTKFESYLREEGLANRIQVRKDGMQKERYARFVKSILGTLDDAAVRTPLGWRFELVPVSGTQFRALYEGKPLAGTLVFALSRDGRGQSARSNGDGLVTFDLTKGEWLIKTVHMVEAPSDSGFDWESLWASITLQL